MLEAPKQHLKNFLGSLPWTVELYRAMRRPRPWPLYTLPQLEQSLPEWAAESAAARTRPGAPLPFAGRKIAVLGYLPYWFSYQTLLGLTLAGLGAEVTLLSWPHHKYNRTDGPFELRNQNLYLQETLAPAQEILRHISLYRLQPAPLPEALRTTLLDTTLRDTQYILQHEEVTPADPVYQMRLARNLSAAGQALRWFAAERPNVIIIPNGAILEFEAVYHAARHAGVQAVTYEFSELSQRIWLAQNADVMRQNTDALWNARGQLPLTPEQTQALRDFFAARQRPLPSADLVFRYQGAARAGAAEQRRQLGLDDRPVVLLPANVIGDSVTLGRQIFSDSMTEWIERTLRYFASHPHLQLVVRVHPGEAMTQGPSVARIVRRTFPEGLPAHIHLIAADAPVNTYDLVELADAGLVYTTTVGLEMAMSGVPVIAVGQAHYRGRGFTLDPDTWEAYFALLDTLAETLAETTSAEEATFARQATVARQARLELAQNYAYRYFFEFPQPFPWHLYHLPEDLAEWPIRRVLSQEGLDRFGRTLRGLAGDPIDWNA